LGLIYIGEKCAENIGGRAGNTTDPGNTNKLSYKDILKINSA
jgi:hypothetical protein